MAYELACKDLGMDCSYVARGKNLDELIADGAKHGKEAHGYTDEQLKDPKLMEVIMAKVKQV